MRSAGRVVTNAKLKHISHTTSYILRTVPHHRMTELGRHGEDSHVTALSIHHSVIPLVWR